MKSEEDYLTKIRFPKTMPPFSSDNPIQALFLKKKGVERLLARNTGRTVGVDFAKEAKTKIEMESMLIDRRRRRDHSWKELDEDKDEHEVSNVVFEMIPFNDANQSQEQIPLESVLALATSASAAYDDYDKCPELSCYDDSDDDSDWSLPGIEEQWASTDIRYIYGDGDFHDSERRERLNTRALAEKDQDQKRSSESSITTIEFIANHYFASYDWIFRCL
jgi:hypothetical protein